MLAVLCTHPIQYQIPIWKELASRGRVPFKVWYATAHGVQPTRDVQFGQILKWDIDLLGGYPHAFPAAAPAQLGGWWDVALPAEFRAFLKSGEVKALLVHGWQVRAYWQAILLAHSLGIQVWIRAESNDLKEDAFVKRTVKKLLLGQMLRRVDRFLAVGRANVRLYMNYGIQSSQIWAAPYCVDNSRFAAEAATWRNKRDALRGSWGIPENAFCVLFVGKFISKKRPADIIAALRLLGTADPKRKYHAMFVGTGLLGATLRKDCQITFDADGEKPSGTVDGQPSATFAGFINQSELAKAYVAADCLVLPSDAQETWGLVVNEALACGIPCIVSNACGSAEDLVMPLDPALTFPVGDQAALARAIKHLAEHPVPRDAIAAQIAQYDFTKTVDTLEGLWSDLQEPCIVR